MPRPRKRMRYMLDEDPHSESDSQNQVDVTIGDEESSSSSTCSSSFPSSSCSSENDFDDSDAADTSQSPQEVYSCDAAVDSVSSNQSSESSDSECEEMEQSESPSPALPCVPLYISETDRKIDELVKFLLFKYVMNEPATRVDMINNVIKNQQEHFPAIFKEASECMLLVFGLEIKEVDIANHSYILVPALGLTYDGLMSGAQGVPKTGLLIMVLCVIFMEGNHAREEVVWRMLNSIGLYAGTEHFLFGEPSQLIASDFVQEGYLEHKPVSNGDVIHYEFLWGPRACAESSKMRILEFFAHIIGSDPRAFPLWFAEALREQEERA